MQKSINASDDGSYQASGPSDYINQLVTSDGIWVARESTDDWAVSVIGAGALRTKLTPLTLSIPNMTGMKIDLQTENYALTVVNSVKAGRMAYIPPHSGLIRGLESNSLLLRGGQLRRKFGVLTIGASYANMYTVQKNREGGHILDGTVSDYAPTPIIYAVRIMDDSPQDGGGPVIHDIKIKVNGNVRPDIIPQVYLDDMRREKVTAVTSKAHQYYYESKSNFSGEAAPFDQTTVYERIPKYLDYMYMNDYARGWNTKTITDEFDIEKGKEFYKIVDPADLPIRVNGNDAKFLPIPNDHPVYHCFFDFDEGPPNGAELNLSRVVGASGGNKRSRTIPKQVHYLEGITIDDRLVAIYSDKGYAIKWAADTNNEPQLKMGVNMVVFALTQEGHSPAKNGFLLFCSVITYIEYFDRIRRIIVILFINDWFFSFLTLSQLFYTSKFSYNQTDISLYHLLFCYPVKNQYQILFPLHF